MNIPEISIDSILSLADNQFAQGGIFLAIATGIFYYLRAVPTMIYQQLMKFLMFRVDIVYSRSDSTYEYFLEWYSDKFPGKFKNTVATISFVKPIINDYRILDTPRKLKLTFAQSNDLNFIWYVNRLIYIRKVRSKLEHANDIGEVYMDEYTISGLFAKQAITNLLLDIVESKQKEIDNATGINLIYGPNDSKNLESFKTFDNLFFKEKPRLLSYLDAWSSRRDKSKEMGIVHKTGISLFGPPGTGKTSIAKAIAHRYSMSLVLVNLSAFNKDSDLLKYISGQNSPCVFLFEDVDEFLGKSKRSNLEGKSTVSFSGILQILDGVNSPDNSIFVLTTNLIEELDPALYRDGRINFRVEVGHPDLENVEKFINKYYDSNILLPPNLTELKMSSVEQVLLNNDSAEHAVETLIKMQNNEV
jgi:hypothetical protein